MSSGELTPTKVAEVARWSDEAGCKGILIYADNRLADPWLVAPIVIQSTKALCLLVAIQPSVNWADVNTEETPEPQFRNYLC